MRARWVVLVAVVACSSASDRDNSNVPPLPDPERILVEAKAQVERACQCHDAGCLVGVMGSPQSPFAQLGRANASLTTDEKQRFAELARALAACRQPAAKP